MSWEESYISQAIQSPVPNHSSLQPSTTIHSVHAARGPLLHQHQSPLYRPQTSSTAHRHSYSLPRGRGSLPPQLEQSSNSHASFASDPSHLIPTRGYPVPSGRQVTYRQVYDADGVEYLTPTLGFSKSDPDDISSWMPRPAYQSYVPTLPLKHSITADTLARQALSGGYQDPSGNFTPLSPRDSYCDLSLPQVAVSTPQPFQHGQENNDFSPLGIGSSSFQSLQPNQEPYSLSFPHGNSSTRWTYNPNTYPQIEAATGNTLTPPEIIDELREDYMTSSGRLRPVDLQHQALSPAMGSTGLTHAQLKKNISQQDSQCVALEETVARTPGAPSVLKRRTQNPPSMATPGFIMTCVPNDNTVSGISTLRQGVPGPIRPALSSNRISDALGRGNGPSTKSSAGQPTARQLPSTLSHAHPTATVTAASTQKSRPPEHLPDMTTASRPTNSSTKPGVLPNGRGVGRNMLPPQNRPSATSQQFQANHPPGSEMSSRKQSISKIIDLTNDLSEAQSRPAHARGSLNARANSLPSTSKAMPPPDLDAHRLAQAKARTTSSMYHRRKIVPAASDAPIGLCDPDIARPLKSGDALSRSTYDPTTIARDVLVAAGRHPTIPPLNDHLKILRETIPAVVLHTDLSTIRWDLIDPGRPISDEDGLQLDGIEDVGASGVPDRPETPLSHGNFLSKSRPQSQSIKPVVNGALSRSGEDDTTSAYFNRQQVARPKHPKRRQEADVETISSRHPKRQRVNEEPFAPKTPGHVSKRPFLKGNRLRVNEPTTLKHPRFCPTNASSTTNHASTSMSSPLPHTSHQNFSKHDRPPDHRKPARNLAVVIPRRAPSTALFWENGEFISLGRHASRGQHTTTTPTDDGQGLPLTVYKCRWKNCSAELHNIVVLRKHVKMMHAHETTAGMLPCLWAKCGSDCDSAREEHPERRLPRLYTTFSLWYHHVSQKHIEPYAWKYGDGPLATSQARIFDAPTSATAENALKSNLSQLTSPYEDEEGCLITPTPCALDIGRVSAKTGRGHQSNIAWYHMLQAEEMHQQAQAIMSYVQAKSDPDQGLGVALDGDGCILTTEEVERGFVDNDGKR